METPGEMIKKAREKAGFSVEDVSERIKILSRYLEAIENNDVKSLPSRVYTLGFVKCYAEFLHLEPRPLCDIFKVQMGWDINNDLSDLEQSNNIKKLFIKYSKKQKILLKYTLIIFISVIGILLICN